MASFRVIRPLARGLCHVQDVVEAQPRSALQLVGALEQHITSSGKELLASLKDSLCWEKMVQAEKLKSLQELVQTEKNVQTEKERSLEFLIGLRAGDQVAILQLKGLNNTRGLFEKIQDDLAFKAQVTNLKGSELWEAILKKNQALRLCIQRCAKISEKDVPKQAAHCSTMYNILSHAGKELAQLQAVHGEIQFHRGPMSPEQVQIFLCMGQAANLVIAEDPSTR